MVTTVGHRALPWRPALGPRAEPRRPLGPLTTYGVGGPAALFVEVEGPDDLDAVRGALPCGSEVPRLRARAGLEPPGRRRRLRRGGPAPRRRFRRTRAAARCPGAPGARGIGGGSDLRGAGRGGRRPAGPGPAPGRRRVVGSVVGGRGAGIGGRGGADERRGPRLGHGGLPGALPLGRPPQRGRRDGRPGPPGLRLPVLVGRRRRRWWWRPSSRVSPGSAEAEREEVAAIVRWRREHQPGGSNAGSVFTNPDGDSAGRLIEAAGLKGFRLGHRARVGEARQLHPGRQGRAGRRRARPDRARPRRGGRARCGVTLRTEVRLLGFGGGKTGPVVVGDEGGERGAQATGARTARDAPSDHRPRLPRPAPPGQGSDPTHGPSPVGPTPGSGPPGAAPSPDVGPGGAGRGRLWASWCGSSSTRCSSAPAR